MRYPWFSTFCTRSEMISLERWSKLKQLREKLNGKAKTPCSSKKGEFRFFRLYDKVYRPDVLEAACAQCRSF